MTGSLYPVAFDDLTPTTDRDAPSLADVLNQLQAVIGLEANFEFAKLTDASFETAVTANSLAQMAAPQAAVNLNSQIITNQAPGNQLSDSATMQQAKNGWVQDTSSSWTFVSSYVFTTTTPNAGFVYFKGVRVQWQESGVIKYGVVKSVSGTNPASVTLVSNTDYLMTVNPDAGTNLLSYGTPQDFPRFFNYAMNWAGFSSPPPTGHAIWTIGSDGYCDFLFIEAGNGTSNSTATSCVLPIASEVGALNFCSGVDNGANVNAVATVTTGTTLGFSNGVNTGAWTASGAKSIQGFQVRYVI